MKEIMECRADGCSQESFPFLHSDQPFPEHLMVRLSQMDEKPQRKDVIEELWLEHQEKHHHRHHHHHHHNRNAPRQGDGNIDDAKGEEVKYAKGEKVNFWNTVQSRCILATKLHSFLTPRPDSRTVSATIDISRAASDQPSQDRRTRRRWKKGQKSTFSPLASTARASTPPPGETSVLEKSGAVKLLFNDKCKDEDREKSDADQGLVVAARKHRGKSATSGRSAPGPDFRRTVSFPSEGQLVGLTSYYHLMREKFPNVRASFRKDSPTASTIPRNYINRACSDPISTLLAAESARVPRAKTALLLRKGRSTNHLDDKVDSDQ